MTAGKGSVFLFANIGLAIFLIVLSATVAAAQGTGTSGCYFDACDDEVRQERDRVYSPGRIPQSASGQLVCTTFAGTCVMTDQSYPAGQFCNCPTQFGIPLDGFTQLVNSAPVQQQQPTIATHCVTLLGNCPLGGRLAVGTPCYCPSVFGPVTGMSQ